MAFDLRFLRYTNPVVAGSKASVVISLSPTSVGAEPVSEAVDVHVGFQGSYPWGDLPYIESIKGVNPREVPLSREGVVEVSVTLDIPYKTLIEFECHRFSYYAYVIPEGGMLTLQTPVIISDPVHIEDPRTVTEEELNALVTQARLSVENSALPNEVKEDLVATLEAQIEALGRLDELTTFGIMKGSLESFTRELESGKAMRYPSAKLWIRQMRFIISRLQKLQAMRTLEKVPTELTFRFYVAIGSYTGVSADSLSEFLERLATIDIGAIEFHVPRRDFENWIRDVLGDGELAERLARIREHGLSGEDLRGRVLDVLGERYAQLRRISSEA